ncbi:MAG: STAS domain-containing protein [Euryarchaeota archaeon]|nr:STAS domain-containing protein [Euryarchaeota archaeon]
MKIPILKLKDILITSIQIDLTDEEAIEFQTDVLAKVSENDADGIVMDITALDIVDSFMARVLNNTATMVRLLGAEVVLCGMQPSVAITLIEMGRELIGVETALNLDQAVDNINELIKSRATTSPKERKLEPWMGRR